MDKIDGQENPQLVIGESKINAIVLELQKKRLISFSREENEDEEICGWLDYKSMTIGNLQKIINAQVSISDILGLVGVFLRDNKSVSFNGHDYCLRQKTDILGDILIAYNAMQNNTTVQIPYNVIYELLCYFGDIDKVLLELKKLASDKNIKIELDDGQSCNLEDFKKYCKAEAICDLLKRK